MNRTVAAALALSLLATGALAQQSATGQSSGGPARVGGPGELEIRPDQRKALRGYVDRQTLAPVELPGALAIGGTVPGTIELRSFPNLPDGDLAAARNYRYFKSGNMIYVVEPESRAVVQIVD
jgi:Protein of unknown function (DUF1236)